MKHQDTAPVGLYLVVREWKAERVTGIPHELYRAGDVYVRTRGPLEAVWRCYAATTRWLEPFRSRVADPDAPAMGGG